MQTTCLYCGLATHISPQQPRCTECGGDLEALIVPEYAAEFYYQHAQEQAFQGDAKQALSTIRRGLDEFDSPDLHLLAAILHQRLGEFDQMRAHVAAIPIDDALRSEGEWLLRSHQARQRGGRRRRVQTENDALAMTPFGQIDNTRGANRTSNRISNRDEKRPRRRLVAWAMPVMAVLLLAVAGWWTWQNGLLDAGLQQLGVAGIPGITQSAQPEVAPVVEAPAQEVLPTPTPLPTTPPPADVVQNSAENGTTAAGATAVGATVGTTAGTGSDQDDTTLINTSPTTDSTAADVATDTAAGVAVGGSTADGTAAENGADAAPSPVASSDEANAAALADMPEVDLSLLLGELGAPELSGLPITANRNGGELILTGTAQTADQRERLMSLLQSVSGVESVNALNLVVRIAETYTTRPGDSLWRIAERIYGDGDRWRDIYALNKNILGTNPGSLFSNIELNLPPMIQ